MEIVFDGVFIAFLGRKADTATQQSFIRLSGFRPRKLGTKAYRKQGSKNESFYKLFWFMASSCCLGSKSKLFTLSCHFLTTCVIFFLELFGHPYIVMKGIEILLVLFFDEIFLFVEFDDFMWFFPLVF